MPTSGRGGSVVRTEYLIDRFRVVFESGGGWHCACAAFAAANVCRHTQEAAGRHAAQIQIRNRAAPAPADFGRKTPQASGAHNFAGSRPARIRA